MSEVPLKPLNQIGVWGEGLAERQYLLEVGLASVQALYSQAARTLRSKASRPLSSQAAQTDSPPKWGFLRTGTKQVSDRWK